MRLLALLKARLFCHLSAARDQKQLSTKMIDDHVYKIVIPGSEGVSWPVSFDLNAQFANSAVCCVYSRQFSLNTLIWSTAYYTFGRWITLNVGSLRVVLITCKTEFVL